jgi:hypothetical protein
VGGLARVSEPNAQILLYFWDDQEVRTPLPPHAGISMKEKIGEALEMPLPIEQWDKSHSTFLDGMWDPASHQGSYVTIQLSCVADEEDCAACSGCVNQVLNPTPASAHEGASFITRENPYLPTPRGSYGSSRSLFSVGLSVRAEDHRCLSTVLCRSVSIQSLPSGLKTTKFTMEQDASCPSQWWCMKWTSLETSDIIGTGGRNEFLSRG